MVQERQQALEQLLKLDSWTDAQRAQVFELAQAIGGDDPEAFAEAWEARFEAARSLLQAEPIGLCKGLSALRASRKLIPLGTFIFQVTDEEEINDLSFRDERDSIHTLDCSHVEIWYDGVCTICDVDWPALRHLNLRANDVQDDGLYALLERHGICFIDGLQTLNLSYAQLSNSSIRDLAASPHVASLEHLDLSDNFIADSGVEAIARSTSLCNLRTLNLKGNSISEEAREAIASSETLREDLVVVWE